MNAKKGKWHVPVLKRLYCQMKYPSSSWFQLQSLQDWQSRFVSAFVACTCLGISFGHPCIPSWHPRTFWWLLNAILRPIHHHLLSFHWTLHSKRQMKVPDWIEYEHHFHSLVTLPVSCFRHRLLPYMSITNSSMHIQWGNGCLEGGFTFQLGLYFFSLLVGSIHQLFQFLCLFYFPYRGYTSTWVHGKQCGSNWHERGRTSRCFFRNDIERLLMNGFNLVHLVLYGCNSVPNLTNLS